MQTHFVFQFSFRRKKAMKKLCCLMMLLFGFYSEAGSNDNKFLSLNYDYHHSLNRDKLGLWGANYGHSIVSQSIYYGFFSTGVKFYVQKKQNLETGSFLNLRYGYEFIRDRVVSFGLDTSMSMGFMKNNQGMIVCTLGVFTRWKAAENVSVLVQTGLSHINPPDTKIKDIVDNKLFGPYVQVELRSYL